MSEISPVNRSKKEAEAAYDKLSRWYDSFEAPFERRPVLAGLTKLNPVEGERILEIGCGTGEALLVLTKAVKAGGAVFGIDLSSKMLSIAQAKLDKSGLDRRTRLVHGDAVSLPFDDNYFDGIFLSFTLELFEEPEIQTVLQQCMRTLKKGGRLCVVSMSGPDERGLMSRAYLWFHRQFPKYADCRPIYVKEDVGEAGFNVIDVVEMRMWGLPVEVVLAKKN
jgi:ubiquinone/menaquinone biosynthesis C-methylase UbiE